MVLALMRFDIDLEKLIACFVIAIEFRRGPSISRVAVKLVIQL